MSNRTLVGSCALSAAFVLPFLAGCGSNQPAVTGSVTVNGAPLDKGQINFQPVGKGRPEGGEVVRGSYTVKGLAAGKYKANVVSTAGTRGPDNMDEAIKAAKAEPNPIPPGTTGNNVEVEITGANQTFDLKLTKPKS